VLWLEQETPKRPSLNYSRACAQVDIPPRLEEGIKVEENFWILKLAEITSLLSAFPKVKEDMKAQLRRFLQVETLCECYSLDIWNGLKTVLISLAPS
jgi:hypothetical protein